MIAPPPVVRPDAERWDAAQDTILLARAETDVERELLRGFARREGMSEAQMVRDGAEAVRAAQAGDLPIAPVRVVWLGSDDGRSSLRDLTLLGSPPPLRQIAQRRALASGTRGDCRIVVGEPARVSELASRWTERHGDADGDGFAAFVDRQADIALERAARPITGERYRSSRRVADELATSTRFVGGAHDLAAQLHRDPEATLADARAYLDEMATEQQRVARDVWTRWAHFLYSRGYELHVDPAQVAQVRELSTRHPLVFLPSHRSNLDGYVMASLLHEQGLAPNHTLGGINMAFWPLGPLGRRVGVIWIRRSFRDNDVYKFALQQYLGYLVSKRFNLEWYIEGGRSRTGKLLPPRLGLFNYLCDAVEDLGIEDLHVIPVSIVYDELQEVREMTTESRGRVKPAEGLPWLIGFARAQRGSYGGVHVNFAEPLRLADALRAHGSAGDATPGARRLARSKAAFEICTRINTATPVTAVSLVTLALLGGDTDRARTLAEVADALEPLRTHVVDRRIPGWDAIALLDAPERIRETLHRLEGHGVVERYGDGPQEVFRIGPDSELVAAFYRNAAIHWFLSRAIVELGLLQAAATHDEDPATAALEDAFRLRDLLKFEFFFPEKEAFRAELQVEVARIDPAWRETNRLAELGLALRTSGALMAGRVLQSFVEAYAIAADELASHGSNAVDPEAAAAACLTRGRQYRLQRRVTSAEAISTHLFGSAFKLAANRGLLEAGPDVEERRVAVCIEVHDVLARLHTIGDLDRQRDPIPYEGVAA